MNAQAYINAIGVSAPANDIQAKFIDYVGEQLADDRQKALFRRMAARSDISSRSSILAPHHAPDQIDTEGFYQPGLFPPTAVRMERFAIEAPGLAIAAVEDLIERAGPNALAGISHLITATCTGFVAPGIDVAVMDRFGLSAGIERTQVGFMGCNAAFNALKLARHIVRSDRLARVLVINVELCTLHFQIPRSVDEALMYLLFGDGAAATLVTQEAGGFRLDRFAQAIIPDTRGEITWTIGDQGFDMFLSGEVPRHIGHHLPAHIAELLGQNAPEDISLWAVHPGGRSVLGAVETALALPAPALATSRGVLREFGNLSSVTVPFILERMLSEGGRGRRGVALGFGPGLAIESFTFAEAA